MNVKKFARESINRSLRRAGMELRPFRPDGDFQLLGELRDLRNERIAQTLHDAFHGSWLEGEPSSIRSAVREFSDLMRHPPVRQAVGGAGFANGLVLFTATRILNPEFIIESGVFRGFSTWVLRCAAPNAEIHCFDLDFSHIEYKDATATYHHSDWADVRLDVPANSFAFFDDHVNQAKRIIEASDRKIRRLIFDDDIPLSAAYADIPMIVPTVSMIMDEDITRFSELAWEIRGRKFAARIDQDQVAAARQRVELITPLPSLTAQTRFSASPYTAVRLKA